jgi:hypothetical protein
VNPLVCLLKCPKLGNEGSQEVAPLGGEYAKAALAKAARAENAIEKFEKAAPLGTASAKAALSTGALRI